MNVIPPPIELPEAPPSLGAFLAWDPPPVPLLPLSAFVMAGWYIWAVRRVRASGREWPVSKTVCFLIGCALLALVTGLRFERYGFGMLSVFMFQHFTLSMTIPPLLVLGSPGTLLLRSTPHTGIGYHVNRIALGALRSRAAAALLHPVIGIPLFLASYYGIYFSPIANRLSSSLAGHTALEVFFLVSGIIFILPVLATGPLPGKHSNIGRLFHLFVEMPLHVFFGVVLMMATAPLLHYYAHPPAGWGIDPLRDQEWAGGFAWAYGEPVALLVVLIFAIRWRRDENRVDHVGAAPDEEQQLDDYNRYLRSLGPQRPASPGG